MATEQDYTEGLKKLAPRGSAWPTENSSNWVKLLSAFAKEFARVDARANQLPNEVYPDTTTELLEDWECVAGLPDPCTGEGRTIPERRKDLLARLSGRGGQSIRYFIELALTLGYVITITEFNAFYVGESSVDDILLDEDWEFVWQVNAPAEQNKNRLECVIRQRSPAHTIVLFRYS